MASNISTALRKVGGLTVQRLSQGLKESNSDASGELDSSISFKVRTTSKGIDLNITMLEYWAAVDGGRKAGKQPPISNILKWLTYPNVRDKIRGGESDAPITNPESLAFLIARKIGKQGTQGTDFATNVFKSPLIQKELPSIVADAVFEDANAAIDELINNFE